MKIFTVNGYPGSGKTTFEDMVIKFTSPFFTYQISTVTMVKEIAKSCGWNGEKTPEDRKFLSDLKDLLTRWLDAPFKDIQKFLEKIEQKFKSYDLDTDRVAVFIDSREPKELQRFKDELGAISVFIRRETDKSELSNHSDAEVENFEYDEVIDNNGSLKDLEEQITKFIVKYNLYY